MRLADNRRDHREVSSLPIPLNKQSSGDPDADELNAREHKFGDLDAEEKPHHREASLTVPLASVAEPRLWFRTRNGRWKRQ
eukprot:5326738-Heterocapsa_arctica.AAC.1